MNCQDYRDRVAIQLADASQPPAGDHGASCPECARVAELARAAWDAAGRSPDEPVPAGVTEEFQRRCRRPRWADLTLLRPGPLAAAALLAVGVLVLLRPGKADPDDRRWDYDADGMSVERYELPPGSDALRRAEEIRREVAPEAWGEGACGLEAGDGFLRVRATPEVHSAVRDYLAGRATRQK